MTERVEEIAAIRLLAACPGNAERTPEIFGRMYKRYRLQMQVTEHLLHHHPQAPKPAGLVRGDDQVEGSAYAVYWKKDVTNFFATFARGCVAVDQSDDRCMHPYFTGDFQFCDRSKACAK